MAKKKLTAEQEKEIKLLQANNEMLEKTKEEAKLRGKEDSVKRIEMAQEDVFEQMSRIDKKIAEDAREASKKEDNGNLLTSILSNNNVYEDERSVFDVLEEHKKEEEIKVSSRNMSTSTIVESTTSNSTSFFNDVDVSAQYDIVPLPSNGECYKSKIGRVPVSYLTAYDENFLTSPSLYNDGLVIDFLLKHKIMTKEIDIDKLCSGDVDAIVLFLRATSYGPEFPIMVKDPKTGEEIHTSVDLGTIKPKDFVLKGDENGYFDFELPVSKDKIKFRFLTRKDERNLKLLSRLENDKNKGYLLRRDASEIKNIIKTDSTLNGAEKQTIIGNLSKVEELANKLTDSTVEPINKIITNKMEMQIVSVNGESDRSFISKYVKGMCAMDSLKFRRYVLENEPGLNFEVEIQRPENLGGGSFKTFLEWDDDVFFNIA